MERISGLVPPVVTPIRSGGVDEEGIARLVEHTADTLDGMVVTGSCGEGTSLTGAERLRAVQVFLDEVDGRIPVIMGVASTSLGEIHEIMDRTRELPLTGYLVPPPYYFKNSPDCVEAFFREVARGTKREVVIYDNPYTSGTTMSVEMLARIVDYSSNVNHVKVTDLDLDKIPSLLDRCDATLLAGSDEVMHHQVLRGCTGAVTASPQVLPSTCRAWFDATTTDGDAAGRPHYDRLLPLVVELLQGPDQYPAVIKAALAHLGVIPSDEVLPPLTPLDNRRRAEIATVLDTNSFDAGA
jgi:4-hydroxy-tetrahydrodipicolinate synthase